ncbi:hypothetical protein [Paramicrobacterium chengjingii]|uniref:Uncharacterized protein n=1 Tax=Paramicrobacterium chengjingii TaxID=2769067 RepID=A0ABX6YLQ2_9MICO|nr:hypothetical protein [Microbacterium chengjingii]QPZ39734.1 hypothetical protein HCR76_06725 [Microbacterium chengjingii]
MGIKHPRKYAEKTFREYGGTRVGSNGHGDIWRFPDGWQMVLPERAGAGHLVGLVREARERYGVAPDHHLGRREKHAPRLDFDRLSASAHAKERLALMTAQAGVTAHDMLHALQLPERVMFDEKYDSWVWVRGVLAIPVAVCPDGFAVIKSVLWADQGLYEEFPREQAG